MTEMKSIRWTEEKNQRRCDLVDKEIEGTLAKEEAIEFECLQQEMLTFRREVAPLPIQEAQETYQELLNKKGR